MRIIMVWGQRKCNYSEQYAPELLQATSEYADDDNPQIINNSFYDCSTSEEFNSVKIIKADIDDKKLAKILSEDSIELKDIEVV